MVNPKPLVLLNNTTESVITLFWALVRYESVDAVVFTDYFMEENAADISGLCTDMGIKLFFRKRSKDLVPKDYFKRVEHEIESVTSYYKDHNAFVFPYNTIKKDLYNLENLIHHLWNRLSKGRKDLLLMTPLVMSDKSSIDYMSHVLVGCRESIYKYGF